MSPTILGERQRNDGMTEIDLDLDGIRKITVSILTANRHQVTAQDLADIAETQRALVNLPKGE